MKFALALKATILNVPDLFFGKSKGHQQHEKHCFRKEAGDCTIMPSELLLKSGIVSESKVPFRFNFFLLSLFCVNALF
jgi:hypothetical protein